jgi:hypothetical protein
MKPTLIESLTNPDTIFIIRGNGEEISIDISKGTINTWAILTEVEKKLINIEIRQRDADRKR